MSIPLAKTFIVIQRYAVYYHKKEVLSIVLKRKEQLEKISVLADSDALFRWCRDNIAQSSMLGQFQNFWIQADHVLAKCRQYDLSIVTPLNEAYPQQLLEIANPPVCLFVKGNINLLRSQRTVAIIGTREPSVRGAEMAFKISESLASEGAVIVSGLALGCDTEAHRGCLQAKGQTIAILAHGLDKIYPWSNKNLSEQIVANGGALVSEYFPGVQPDKHHFIERNRIQSALSQAVIIIESAIKGGTMHTAEAALAQHRPLACLSSLAGESAYTSGNAMLLREKKAVEITTVADAKKFVKQFFVKIEGAGRSPKPLTMTQLMRAAQNKFKALEIQLKKISEPPRASQQQIADIKNKLKIAGDDLRELEKKQAELSAQIIQPARLFSRKRSSSAEGVFAETKKAKTSP